MMNTMDDQLWTKYEKAFPPIALTHFLKSAKLKNEGVIKMKVHGR
jgi:hypothetical protein